MLTINECCRTCTHTRRLACRCRVATNHSSMSLSAHFQLDITIVEVHGAIDACNTERLSDYVAALAGPGRALVIDLYCVNFFGAEGFRAMVRITEQCKRKSVRWALVRSDAVERLLRITDSNYRLPTAAWLVEALQRLTRHDHACSPPQRITPPELTRC
jgi:anti-anti-sigma factor